MIRTLLRMGLGALAGALGELAENTHAWSYTIVGFDKSRYITRTLLPRIGKRRVILHRIHRADADAEHHDHPWSEATFYVLTGGYTEERIDPMPGMPINVWLTRKLRPGDTNRLTRRTFHRITSVEPNTWTIGIVGERVQGYSFRMKDGTTIPSAEFYAMKNKALERGAGIS